MNLRAPRNVILSIVALLFCIACRLECNKSQDLRAIDDLYITVTQNGTVVVNCPLPETNEWPWWGERGSDRFHFCEDDVNEPMVFSTFKNKDGVPVRP